MNKAAEFNNYANGMELNRMLKNANKMRRNGADPFARNNSEEFKNIMKNVNVARANNLLETPESFTHMVNKAARKNRKSRKNRRDRKTRRQRKNRKSRKN